MLSEGNTGNLSPYLDTFSFDVNDMPKPTLHFALTSKPQPASKVPTASTILKRARPATDVDGEGSEHKQKKKRRLRLDLITSRLSQPYATPTTYIVGRGNTKVKRRSRRRHSGLSILRMAALINSTRVHKIHRGREYLEDTVRFPIEDSEAYEEKIEMMNERRCLQRHLGLNVQRRPRSPLGLTDYDAIDREDPYGDDDSDDECSDSEEDCMNSDPYRWEKAQTTMPNYNVPTLTGSDNVPSLSRKPSLEEINALVQEEKEQQEVSLALFEIGF